MGNIIGEGFNKKIIKQIDQRQKIYGSLNRDNEQLTYLNTKTGWCRLVSGVSVDNSVLNTRNLQGANANIAAQYILHNGIDRYDSGSNTIYYRAGVAETNNIHSGAAYGLGGTEFGLRPMPGIISAEIKTETRGSIKRATVRIQANNRAQFDIIDILYMRLGYSMLLEWGSSSYFDNDGKYVKDNTYNLFAEFLDGKYTDIDGNKQNLNYNNILNIIEQFRLKSYGNYDALFCKVVNFSWTLTKDGKYDITLNLISLGDVIESLKANVLYSSENTNFLSIPLPYSTPPTGSTLSQLLWGGWRIGGPGSLYYYFFGPNTPTAVPPDSIYAYRYSHEIGKFFYKIYLHLESSTGNFAGIAPASDPNGSTAYFKQIFSNGPQIYYIRLGYFLEWLQTNVLYNIDNDSAIKIVKIDTDVDTNIISILPIQVSSDVNVCVFKNSYLSETAEAYRQNRNQETRTYFASPDGDNFVHDYGTDNKYGYLMNAYFSLDYILNEINNKKDKNGKTSVYDILTSLCNGWNQSTGYYNNLEVTVDPDTNTARFTDSTLLPDRDTILVKKNPSASVDTALFDTYRYVYEINNDNITSRAGFIKDLSFTTTVSPNFATMITVGATEQGYVIGEDATALSRMNLGITDRYKETINNPIPSSQTTSNIADDLEIKYNDALASFEAYIREVGYTSYSTGTITKPSLSIQAVVEDFKQTQTQLLEYYQAKQVIDKQIAAQAARANDPNAPGVEVASSNTGFLPFNLSLTMDGLSGMKVYQKFTIETDFLPTNYPRALEFLIVSIHNKIENNQWITIIDSMCIAKDPFGAVSNTSQTGNATTLSTTGALGATLPTTAGAANVTTTTTATTTYIPPPASNTPLLTKAVTDQSQYVFNSRGEALGLCANYTYNIAYKLLDHITTNSQQAITFTGGDRRGTANKPSGGNANENSHRQFIKNLGLYDEYYIGEYTPKQLKQWASTQKFNYGDILNYYAPGYSGPHNMHSQIYTGTIFKSGKTKSGTAGNSGWTTSVKTNYGGTVIYNNSLTFKVYYYQVKPEYQV